MKTKYEEQAKKFLADNGIKFRATLSDSKPEPWSESKQSVCGAKAERSQHHYRVTLSKQLPFTMGQKGTWTNRLTFDFWGSISDAEKGVHPSAYDVLACISSDAYCADSFKDWCADFGESEDSIRALQTYRRCHAFAKRLQAFFTAAELEQLQTIN